MKKRNFLTWLIPALVLFAAGFGAACAWDLSISHALYSPDNFFGILVEAFFWYPAFLPTIFLAMLYATAQKELRRSWWEPVLGWLVGVAGMGALYWMSYGYLKDRNVLAGRGDTRTWVLLAVGVLLLAAAFVATRRIGLAARKKLVFFGWCSTVYLVANQVVVYLLKFLWQRSRFDDMLATNTLTRFTDWFQPSGHGGSSFPSGHTANAAGIFVLIILCDLFVSWDKHRVLVYIICWAYVGLTAFGRILIGRHFLSDTLAAAGLMALMFFALRSAKFYRRGLRRVGADSIRPAPQGGTE